jgi:hypothetical protein
MQLEASQPASYSSKSCGSGIFSSRYISSFP